MFKIIILEKKYLYLYIYIYIYICFYKIFLVVMANGHQLWFYLFWTITMTDIGERSI